MTDSDDDALAMGIRKVPNNRWTIAMVAATSLASGTAASYLTVQITQATQAEKIASLEKANVAILENLQILNANQVGCQEKTARLEARQETVFWALTEIRTAIKENHQLLLEHEKESKRR